MTGLVLPQGYKGLEEAMQDCKVAARDLNRERCIGLMKDGRRVFDFLGTDRDAQIADEFYEYGHDVFVIHGHPRIPTELSAVDIECILALNGGGNMAVCSIDDTVSWASHPLVRNHIQRLMVKPFMQDVLSHVVWTMDGEDPKQEMISTKDWSDEDERLTVVSHWQNYILQRSGFLPQYEAQVGAKAAAILEKWEDRMKNLKGE